MALFTGKGDSGTTKFFNTEKGKRVSKSSSTAEALGALDEVNSFLGVCKSKSRDLIFDLGSVKFRVSDVAHKIQNSLFIIQAEVAGADKTIFPEKIKNVEDLINTIEKAMPPIKSFFISGGPQNISPRQFSGAELSAYFDVVRTLARRAERRVIATREEGVIKISDSTAAYLNRLSSLLYALARLINHKSGIVEESPSYK